MSKLSTIVFLTNGNENCFFTFLKINCLKRIKKEGLKEGIYLDFYKLENNLSEKD